MATSSDSLSELERQAETTRAELAQTVDALHNRVSPGAIKADVRSYVHDNPLQAAAIAVGIAYPVWRLIGSIPAPILLIGAGLALGRRSGSIASAGHRSSAAGPGMMSTLKDTASDISSEISDRAHEAVENMRAMASERTSQASEAAADTLHHAADQAKQAYAQTRDAMADMIERHPLMAGGVALVAGSILAAAVPVSRQESRLMGETSAAMRRRSEDVALQGLREAKKTAQQVYETAAEQLRQEGLTPEAARRTARTAAEGARGAMENTTSGGTGRS